MDLVARSPKMKGIRMMMKMRLKEIVNKLSSGGSRRLI